MATTNNSSLLDLGFVMDCTGSMGSYIKSATDNIRLIVDEIVSKEMVNIRLALVEYRDHPPQDTCFWDSTFVTRVHKFTDKVQEMKQWLEQCSAQGGGDGPEAVADALNDASGLPWRREATKFCVLISDAPPHGLQKAGDSFPDGCPLGFDPLKIAREMAQNHITLYVVGVEPPIVPFREFFMTLAHITGGQYVPMVDAKRLADMMVAAVREEISIDRILVSSRNDIIHVVQKATSDGADETETAKRLQRVFSAKNVQVNRMKNESGIPSRDVEESYAKCADMSDIQSIYKTSQPANQVNTADMDYGFQEKQDVTVEQAKRILQKAKNWDISTSKTNQKSEKHSKNVGRSQMEGHTRSDRQIRCRYGSSCHDHSEYHRGKYLHPEENETDETNMNASNICKYGSNCYDHTEIHRRKYSHPEETHVEPKKRSQQTVCKYGSECHDHSEYHRGKYSHPENNSTDIVKINQGTPCRYGSNCHDHSTHHRLKYDHTVA